MSKKDQQEFDQFESNLKSLELIVEKMKDETLPLNQAVDLFEKGSILAKNCEQTLKLAKQKIEMLDLKDE